MVFYHDGVFVDVCCDWDQFGDGIEKVSEFGKVFDCVGRIVRRVFSTHIVVIYKNLLF
jgi:hypothetical protein